MSRLAAKRVRRRARNDWNRPLNVVIVLVRDGAVDPAAIETMGARVSILEARLADELHRSARSRLEWAKLFRRTFLDDVLTCRAATAAHESSLPSTNPTKRRFLASIHERSVTEPLRHARDLDDAPSDSTEPAPPSEPGGPPPSEPATELLPPDD